MIEGSYGAWVQASRRNREGTVYNTIQDGGRRGEAKWVGAFAFSALCWSKDGFPLSGCVGGISLKGYGFDKMLKRES